MPYVCLLSSIDWSDETLFQEGRRIVGAGRPSAGVVNAAIMVISFKLNRDSGELNAEGAQRETD